MLEANKYDSIIHNMNGQFSLAVRRRELRVDSRGYNKWEDLHSTVTFQPERTVLVLCDVWDHHWSRGAEERLELIVPQINATANAARNLGVLVVHAPSNTMDWYKDHPARIRIQETDPVEAPEELVVVDPPLPIDGSNSSDTNQDPKLEGTRTWTCQHPGVRIDPKIDIVSDDGNELYALYHKLGIKSILLAGVHANACMLDRSFAIKQMVRWQMPIYLLRDLTDCMYNPAQAPYVSHEVGLELIVRYIEQFWCPSATGAELRLVGRPANNQEKKASNKTPISSVKMI